MSVQCFASPKSSSMNPNCCPTNTCLVYSFKEHIGHIHQNHQSLLGSSNHKSLRLCQALLLLHPHWPCNLLTEPNHHYFFGTRHKLKAMVVHHVWLTMPLLASYSSLSGLHGSCCFQCGSMVKFSCGTIYSSYEVHVPMSILIYSSAIYSQSKLAFS